MGSIKKIKQIAERHFYVVLFFITTCISIAATSFFYMHGNETLSNYDAIARLDLARKLIDSITPGVGQLGAIWLPFPQIFMLPFVWNDFLWHSGFAGSVVSEVAFIVSAIFLEKTAFLITHNRKASLLVWFIFVTNINMLLFQSMPMSESFFLLCIIMTLYFLTKWMLDQNIASYLAAAFFVTCGTLTRYEGYFIFVGASITVLIKLLMLHGKKRNFSEIEGMFLVFFTVSAYGIFLWCLYCLIFFKDPLHWLHLYAGNNVSLLSAQTQTQQNSLSDSFSSYSQIAVWMNGIVASVLGIAGVLSLIVVLIKKIRQKGNISVYLPLLVITIVLFSLLIYGYQRGYIPHVTFEAITPQHMLSKKFNIYPGGVEDAPNIRYGLIMVPFVALFVGFFGSRTRLLLVSVFFLVCIQLYTLFATQLLLEFSVPRASRFTVLPAAEWMQSHYTDDGLILVSDNTNEDFMFETGLSYNHFIYEGTREYWTTSLRDPSQYAHWVVYQTRLPGDLIYEALPPSGYAILKKKYKLVYSDKKGYKIYHVISS